MENLKEGEEIVFKKEDKLIKAHVFRVNETHVCVHYKDPRGYERYAVVENFLVSKLNDLMLPSGSEIAPNQNK